MADLRSPGADSRDRGSRLAEPISGVVALSAALNMRSNGRVSHIVLPTSLYVEIQRAPGSGYVTVTCRPLRASADFLERAASDFILER